MSHVGRAEHRDVQATARAALAALGPTITAQDTEQSIATRAHDLLSYAGCADTWYHECPALVLLGSRSCLSASGRTYVPATEAVGDLNVITVDVSPSRKGVWGDCARTFFVENGRVVSQPANEAFQDGARVLRDLHDLVLASATPDMHLGLLFEMGNHAIARLGYENLDFKGNLGHSIVARLQDRSFVTRGNEQRLGEAGLFTFEPHVRRIGGSWGFKHEDIYYFDGSRRACVL